jgi:hypothetical protein
VWVRVVADYTDLRIPGHYEGPTHLFMYQNSNSTVYQSSQPTRIHAQPWPQLQIVKLPLDLLQHQLASKSHLSMHIPGLQHHKTPLHDHPISARTFLTMGQSSYSGADYVASGRNGRLGFRMASRASETPKSRIGWVSSYPLSSDSEDEQLWPNPEPGPEAKPTPTPKPQPLKPSSARFTGYLGKRCQRHPGGSVERSGANVDTCVQTSTYKSVAMDIRAVCGNGTEALIATYSRPGCDSEHMVRLGPAFQFDRSCIPTDNIDSLTFWCEGPPPPKSGTDDENGGVGGFIMAWFIVSLVLRLFLVVAAVGCIFRGAALMKQVDKLIERVEALFQRNEGAIRLE